MKKIALLGATRGMGRATARLLAERGDRVFLLGRESGELEKAAQDLLARSPQGQTVSYAHCDLEDTNSFAGALDAAEKALDGLDVVVVTAGLFATQEALEEDSDLAAKVLQVDFSNTVLFCEEVRKRLLQRGGGTLCVFSSVAGDRGRKPVVMYGAAKAGLSHYLEGLDSKFRSQGLRTVCVKPGFVRTGMTQGLKEPPFTAEAVDVAEIVVKAIDAGTPVVYAPPIWKWVMTAVKALPRFAMRRVGF